MHRQLSWSFGWGRTSLDVGRSLLVFAVRISRPGRSQSGAVQVSAYVYQLGCHVGGRFGVIRRRVLAMG